MTGLTIRKLRLEVLCQLIYTHIHSPLAENMCCDMTGRGLTINMSLHTHIYRQECQNFPLSRPPIVTISLSFQILPIPNPIFHISYPTPKTKSPLYSTQQCLFLIPTPSPPIQTLLGSHPHIYNSSKLTDSIIPSSRTKVPGSMKPLKEVTLPNLDSITSKPYSRQQDKRLNPARKREAGDVHPVIDLILSTLGLMRL
jgi:hypothetical protein